MEGDADHDGEAPHAPAPSTDMVSLDAIAAGLSARAAASRADGRARDAAVLYAEALHLTPDRPALHRHAAAAYAAAGDADEAERHYRAAVRFAPDGETLFALARFLAERGRLREAIAACCDTVRAKPDWAAPREEIRRLTAIVAAPVSAAPGLRLEDSVAEVRVAGAAGAIAPELAPRGGEDRLTAHPEMVDLRQLGRRERTHWGTLPTLRGLQAVRGICIADTRIYEVQLLLDGQLIYRGPVDGGYRLANERERPDRQKYVFNIWLDFGGFAHGRHQLECRCIDIADRALSRHDMIVVAAPADEAAYPDSDALVDVAADHAGSPEALVATRPSMVRAARRALFAEPPRTVLVQRVDQLGDMAVSVPALRRLRALLPGARIVGLVSDDNVALADTLGLFDETIAIAFPFDAADRRRVMPIAAQEALRARLAPYGFDLAIDLSENASSRPLLLLSGARRHFGFPGADLPQLAIEAGGVTRDRLNGHETVPHANKLLAFVEWLGGLLTAPDPVARRDGLDPARLAAYGIGAGERFALLHSGARLAFSRWPHFAALAALIVARTDLKVVLLGDDPPPPDLPRDRIRYVAGRVPFDDLDLLVSACAVMVGNDSGPKHLAALRGAPVVSVHMARNNWNEWGQLGNGLIVSRRLPCAGCLIEHDPDECGRGFVCITAIAPDEVFAAVARLVG